MTTTEKLRAELAKVQDQRAQAVKDWEWHFKKYLAIHAEERALIRKEEELRKGLAALESIGSEQTELVPSGA